MFEGAKYKFGFFELRQTNLNIYISAYKGITMFAALGVGRRCLRANEF